MSPAFFEKIINHIKKIGLLNTDKVVGKKQSISLHNWGEPFLNPELNGILQVLKKIDFQANVSSTFIVNPKIDNDLLSVLGNVTFSLSGFSQASYERIHGFSLSRVLENFETFYTKIRKYSPGTTINIAWHRYRFNENELWDAYNYFKRPGIVFAPVVAYINDLSEMLSYVNGEMPDDRKQQVEKDMFLDRLTRNSERRSLEKKKNVQGYSAASIGYGNDESPKTKGVEGIPILLHGALAKNRLIEDNSGSLMHKSSASDTRYDCHMWTQLVIDEVGQVLLCCGMTSEDKNQIIGNIFDLTAESFWAKRVKDPFCQKCFSTEEFLDITTQQNYLPFTWNIAKYLGLWYQTLFPYGFGRKTLTLLARCAKLLPRGEHAVNYIKTTIGYR